MRNFFESRKCTCPSHQAHSSSVSSFLCRLIICLSCPVAERVDAEATRWGRVCCHLSELHPPKEWQDGRWDGRVGIGIGFCSFVIGSFVAKNLEILLTYKYVRVCLVSSVYGYTWICVCGCARVWVWVWSASIAILVFDYSRTEHCVGCLADCHSVSQTLSANVHLCKCLSGSVTSPIVKCHWPFTTHTMSLSPSLSHILYK